MNIKSLYICVNDMKRAIEFYKELFKKEPLIIDEIYSIFNINGFRFGLFNYKKVKEKHTFGSNCIPSIEINNIKELKEIIKNKEICFPLTEIGNNWVVEIVDSENNHIELTTPINDNKVLLDNIHKIHTTKLGTERIKKNLNINIDIEEYCKKQILNKECNIYKKGKNWYCEINNIIITINSLTYTIITAKSR